MTDVRKSRDGNWYLWGGTDWQQITEQEARDYRANAATSALGGFIQGTVGTGLGAMQLLGSEQAAQQRRQMVEDLTPVREANPIAFGGGQVAALAAPGFLPGTLRGAIGVETGIGATQTPENPALGAAIGAGATAFGGAAIGAIRAGSQRGLEIGNTVVNASRSRRQISAAVDDSVGAARTPDPDFNATTQRPLQGLLTGTEADELGITLTRGERAALDAGTPDELARANQLRNTEDLLTSTPVRGLGISMAEAADETIGRFTGARFAREEQESFLTNYIARELGDPNIENLTAARRGELRREVQSVFKEYIDRNPRPIPSENAIETAEGIAENAGVNSAPRLQSYLEKIRTAGQGGEFDATEFSSLRNAVSRDTERAFRAGNYELGSGLSQVQEALDDALERVLDVEAKADIRQARRRWGILKALERVNAVSADGTINVRSFYNAYRANNPGIRTGTRQDEFARVLETLRFLTSRQTNDSGTAARLIANSVGTGAPIGAILLGGGGLLSQ